MESHDEQRQHVRRYPSDNVYVALGEGYARVGRMYDMSKGGLSFEYIVYEEETPEKVQKIDIFISKDEFHLSGVPCEVIYDIHVTAPTSSLFTSNIISKRCGVRFTGLSTGLENQIDTFMSMHTGGTV